MTDSDASGDDLAGELTLWERLAVMERTIELMYAEQESQRDLLERILREVQGNGDEV